MMISPDIADAELHLQAAARRFISARFDKSRWLMESQLTLPPAARVASLPGDAPGSIASIRTPSPRREICRHDCRLKAMRLEITRFRGRFAR